MPGTTVLVLPINFVRPDVVLQPDLVVVDDQEGDQPRLTRTPQLVVELIHEPVAASTSERTSSSCSSLPAPPMRRQPRVRGAEPHDPFTVTVVPERRHAV